MSRSPQGLQAPGQANNASGQKHLFVKTGSSGGASHHSTTAEPILSNLRAGSHVAEDAQIQIPNVPVYGSGGRDHYHHPDHNGSSSSSTSLQIPLGEHPNPNPNPHPHQPQRGYGEVLSDTPHPNQRILAALAAANYDRYPRSGNNTNIPIPYQQQHQTQTYTPESLSPRNYPHQLSFGYHLPEPPDTDTDTASASANANANMSLSYESRGFMPETSYSMNMAQDPQDQDEFKHDEPPRYPSPPMPPGDNPYNVQAIAAATSPDVRLEMPELPKEESDAPSPRSKPVPKPDRMVTKDENGRFYCTWPGCTEDVRDFGRKCEWR